MNNLSILSQKIRQNDGCFLLNDLHKAAGGEKRYQVNNFVRLDQTQELIREIKLTSDMRLPIVPVRSVGTYACKQLVIAYAAWISPKIHLAVINAFLDKQSPVLKMPTRMLSYYTNGQLEMSRPVPEDAYVIPASKFAEALDDAMCIPSEVYESIAQVCIEKLASRATCKG